MPSPCLPWKLAAASGLAVLAFAAAATQFPLDSGTTAFVVSVLAALTSGALGWRLARRLRGLTQAVAEFASGNFGWRVPAGGRDEVGQLAAALAGLGETLGGRIGELQRGSRQRAESEVQLRTVLGSMVEGVVAVDNAERVLFANRAARAMLDFVGANPVGRPIWETVRNPTIQGVVRAALEGNRPSAVEFEVPRKQATVALIAAPLAGQPPPGVVLVLHDVTELRRLEGLRRDFVSNVSHELKTPLTAIQAYTETLLEGAVDDPGVNRRFLKSIEEQADRLHELILDLLRLARIESGRDTFEVTSVPVADAVGVCVEAQTAIASAKRVALRVEPPETSLSVLADAEALRTVLENLVSNAVKYTPEGGSATVRWRRDGEMARIEVVDTGVGIPRAHHARIFERFYRVDKARNRDLGGTGLGLSIVKHLVQVFGGTVEVASEVGRGSTFTVRLPLA